MMTEKTRTPFAIEDNDPQTIAALLGCEAGHGLVNRMNKLNRAGRFEGAEIINDMMQVVLNDLLAECSKAQEVA